MASFEKIVRPFETRNTSPAIDVSLPSSAPATVKLSIGANGSGKTLQGSESFSVNTYLDRHPREQGSLSDGGSVYLNNSDIYTSASDIYG